MLDEFTLELVQLPGRRGADSASAANPLKALDKDAPIRRIGRRSSPFPRWARGAKTVA